MCQAWRHFQRNDCERGNSRIILLKRGNPRKRRIVKLVLWVQISLLDCTGRWPSSTEVELTQAWSSGGQLEVDSLHKKTITNINAMCTSVKLWGNKTLNADYQNTKEFWENKSILREQFNFENKSWERLLEDLQSNFLRMLVKNITYMKLLDILNLSRTWKVGTLFRKFPAQRQPHHQQFTSTYQFNQGSHRGEILILPRPLCLQIHMSQLSELNFSSIGFRREVDENSKFKWIWGELVLF